MTTEETRHGGADGGNASRPNDSAGEIVFSGTLCGSVFVGDEPPYESLPWYQKTPFAVALMVIGGLASVVLVASLVGRGVVGLLVRGHASMLVAQAVALASAIVWAACMALNVARVLKGGAGRMSVFDLIAAAASPALAAGGLASFVLYAQASPVFAVLIAAVIAACMAVIFEDPAETPLETRGARLVEGGATAGALFLMAFTLFTL